MIKVYHYKMLTDEERDRLNRSTGWDSEPRFSRYSNITCGMADASTILSALLYGEYEPVATVRSDDRNVAFHLTNHLESNWQVNNGVSSYPGEHRSTSVGDIMEDMKTGELFLVANYGFQKLTLLNERPKGE